MTRAAVIGTTGWGTTLAVLLARNGHETLLWARSAHEAETLALARENQRHRPGLLFPDSLSVDHALDGLAGAELVILAVPSSRMRENLERIGGAIDRDASVVSAAKGLEIDSLLRMSQLLSAAGVDESRVLALSGPNFASEIAAGLPAATVIAGSDASRTSQAQAIFSGPALRVYTSDDVTGVEIGGALKNVVAIACGLSDGLGYGENAKAALITRALAEITRLGVALGARPLTFLGLAGIGDLILSCESNLSRNRRAGLAVARGASLAEALAASEGVVEGVVTARCIPGLVARTGVEMPICAALYSVLYEGKPPQQAVVELMSRSVRPERD